MYVDDKCEQDDEDDVHVDDDISRREDDDETWKTWWNNLVNVKNIINTNTCNRSVCLQSMISQVHEIHVFVKKMRLKCIHFV